MPSHKPRAAMVEMNVIVMLRSTSPPKSKVQKLDMAPPGQQPSTRRPNPCRGSLIKASAKPNETCKIGC